MRLALCRAPRNSVACERTTSSLEHAILLCVREACNRVVGKQEAAAKQFGVSAPHFSRQLAGLERLTIEQLARCPEIVYEFAALLAKQQGHRLAPRLSPSARRRLVEARQAELDIARLNLEAALDEDATSGAASLAS